MFQENKERLRIFRKTSISYPLIRTRNVRFLENFACFIFLKHPFWDSLFYLITNEVTVGFWLAIFVLSIFCDLDAFYTRVYSCQLMLIRVESCPTCIYSCWHMLDACKFVLTYADLCWYSFIRIDFIKKMCS